MYALAALFIIIVLLNGMAITWLYLTAPTDNKLFYDLFDNSVKEEIFLTEIEKGLDCISDDDKELHPAVVSFDRPTHFFVETLILSKIFLQIN